VALALARHVVFLTDPAPLARRIEDAEDRLLST